jgi:hypothetical protein
MGALGKSTHHDLRENCYKINGFSPCLCYTAGPHVGFLPLKKKTMPQKSPWNKGKSVGQKAPFRPRDVQTIKQILENGGNLRDLALFSVGIDTMGFFAYPPEKVYFKLDSQESAEGHVR